MPDPFNMGHLVEGTAEQDPITDNLFIRTVDAEGKTGRFDVQGALAAHVGKEVRFTLVSFENLAKLAELVERGGGPQVAGLAPDGLPGFDVKRKA